MHFLSGLEKRDVCLATSRRHFNPPSWWEQLKCRATEKSCGFGRCSSVEVIGHCRYEKPSSRALNTSHPERSEAESKDPAAKLKRNATEFLASLGLTSVRHDFILSR